MFKFNRYLAITKVDDEERMVYGWASTPDLDSDGEVIKLDALEKALPAYMQFPTLREMHQPKAAGTTKSAKIIDKNNERGLYIGAKVVSDEAWKLIKEGVYKGFSIGGNVVKQIKNIITDLELVEISLVDVPANKAAKIEVWKAEGMNKNADTAMSMANLMMQVKYACEYYEYMGKDAKKLNKILEMLKELVAMEASEPEPQKEKGNLLNSPDALRKQASLLSEVKITDNPAFNAVVKGVMIAMSKKADELEKDATVVDETTKTVETVDEKETTEVTPTKDEGETPEGGETTSTTEGEPNTDKEAGTLSGDLEKVANATKKIEKLNPVVVKADPEKESLTKAVSTMAAAFSKMADTLVSFDERLKTVEATPAEVKSKTVAVYKSTEDAPKDDVAKKATSADEIQKKQARLGELDDLFSKMGPAAFAKAGYSVEAGKLQSEIESLVRKG